jgi:hypothetical protein
MGISVNSSPVNRRATDPSQNKASKAKSKADKDKTIQSEKESSKAKTDSKDHQKLLKSLYVSHSETIKNFGLAGKSLLGSRPILAPWKEETDTTDAKNFKDDSKASSAKDEESQSTNKLRSKTLSSSVAASSKKKLEEKSSTSSKVAQNQSKTNINKKNKASTATKAAHSKTIDSEAKISKASSGAISTQQEMDEFLDVLIQGVKTFQAKIGTKESKSPNTKNTLKGKSKDGKSATTSLFDDDSSSLANNLEPQAANKSNAKEMSEFNKLHQNKSKKFSSYGSEISDDQTYSKDNTSHFDKNIPEHILNARKYSMALKGNINNIANNASLQSLINRYLDTRGSYSIKIMIEMEKLKKGKGKTTSADLSDAQKARSLASDKQISEMKEVNEKQEESRKVQKALGILGVVMAVVAVIISLVAIVGTGGTMGPVLVLAIVGVIAGMVSLGISSGEVATTTVEGRTMGTFDACIYKSYRSYGASQKKALKDTQYTTMGIQAGLVIITIGTSFAAGSTVGEGIIKVLDAISNKIASLSPALASAANAGTRLATFFAELADTSAAEAELTSSWAKHTVGITQGILGGSQAGLMGYKTYLDYGATTLQAKVTEIQGVFENIEQHEHVAQTLMQKSVKRISEATGSVVKTLDSEYQAIKLLNMRSKVA